MSAIATVIAERLLADGTVAAIVGSRVYQLKLPQAPRYPAIKVQLIAEPQTYHNRGPNGLTRSVVQIDTYASEMDATNPNPLVTANRLARAVDQALSGQQFTSDTGSPAIATYQVQGIFRDNEMQIYEQPELRLVRISLDYAICFQELPPPTPAAATLGLPTIATTTTISAPEIA